MTPETQNVEWKRSWRDEYLKWICGFANAQGGVLEIGKDDTGEVVGVRGVLRLLEEIPNKVQSLLGIVVDVDLMNEDGREYLRITVVSHPNPISYKGEFHYRSGSTKQVLRGAALSRFLLGRYGRTWDDVPVPGVTLRSLSSTGVSEFRHRGVESGRLSPGILGQSDEAVLEQLQLREAEFLKRAAALLFHPAPQRLFMGAVVKVGYFRRSEVLFQDLVEGDLFGQVDRTMDLLYTKYTRGLISYDGIYRVETFPVPREAMREAIINAVIHRDYASSTTIQIRVYDDRIMIFNPAHLFPDWIQEQRSGILASRPHNPRVAYAFFRAGLIEAWGRGILRITRRCREVGNPEPVWRLESGGNGLWLTFPFSSAYQAADAAARGIGTPSNDQGTARTDPDLLADSQKTARKQPEISSLSDRILDLLIRKPGASRRKIASALGTSASRVRYHLDKLRAAGRLERVGPDKGGHWKVLD